MAVKEYLLSVLQRQKLDLLKRKQLDLLEEKYQVLEARRAMEQE